jgi:hypothetical protein
MSNIHLLPDQRIPKAMDEIVQILYDLDPPIHTSTAIGILELCKAQVIAEQRELLNGD